MRLIPDAAGIRTLLTEVAASTESEGKPWFVKEDANGQPCLYAGSRDHWVALFPHQCLAALEVRASSVAKLFLALHDGAPALLDAYAAQQDILANSEEVTSLHRYLCQFDDDRSRRLANIVIMHARWREEGLARHRELVIALDKARRFRGWRVALFANINGKRINPRGEIMSRSRAFENSDYHRSCGYKAHVMRVYAKVTPTQKTKAAS